jgi:hypothetical protein
VKFYFFVENTVFRRGGYLSINWKLDFFQVIFDVLRDLSCGLYFMILEAF